MGGFTTELGTLPSSRITRLVVQANLHAMQNQLEVLEVHDQQKVHEKRDQHDLQDH